MCLACEADVAPKPPHIDSKNGKTVLSRNIHADGRADAYTLRTYGPKYYLNKQSRCTIGEQGQKLSPTHFSEVEVIRQNHLLLHQTLCWTTHSP
jgi:hypothetical protein